MQQFLMMPVTMLGAEPLVTVKLNGTEVHLMLDTGAFFSMLYPEAAHRAGLNIGSAPLNLMLGGVGGRVRPDLTTVKDFTIGSQTLHRVEMLVYGDRLSSSGADGIMGQNLLRSGDFELDLANGTAKLFKTDGCGKANLAYWAGPAAVGVLPIRATDSAKPQVIASAQVNDVDIRVMFDSGAATSGLTLHAASRAGITPQSPGVTPGGVRFGVGNVVRDTWIAPFRSFKLDAEEIKNTHLRIGELGGVEEDADMLLGADFFLSHRVLISYEHRKVFFTYNGGAVFDLSVRRGPTQLAGTPPTSSAPATQTPDAAPENAADIDRQATALLARGELPAAIGDFNRAIADDPGNAGYRYHRAEALVRSGSAQQAMPDLDEALRLQPHFVDALMLRAQIRVRSGRLEAAKMDFAAAEASAPDLYQLPLQEAGAYADTGHYPIALDILDHWIAAHPNDDRRYDAMSTRCLVRGMLGTELEEALDDCNTARRHGDTNSQVLYNRGIVQLRRKQYAKAISDFDDTIKLQPRLPRAFYARGLARIASGQKSTGEADLQTALGMNPRVAGQFRDVDLNP